MSVLVEAKNNIPKHVTKNLKEEPLKTSYVVPAGDILMIKLK